jgi:hypothetical protein
MLSERPILVVHPISLGFCLPAPRYSQLQHILFRHQPFAQTFPAQPAMYRVAIVIVVSFWLMFLRPGIPRSVGRRKDGGSPNVG